MNHHDYANSLCHPSANSSHADISTMLGLPLSEFTLDLKVVTLNVTQGKSGSQQAGPHHIWAPIHEHQTVSPGTAAPLTHFPPITLQHLSSRTPH